MLPKAKNSWSLIEAAHLLNRAGFGGNPEEIRDFHALGREPAVDFLLAPSEALSAFPLPAWTAEERQREDRMAAREQRLTQSSKNLTPEEAAKANREARRKIQRENRRRAFDAQGWWFKRMLTTRAPLREKMTLFWHDHFATSYQKVKQPTLLIRQNELFRRNALGSFHDLTQAVLMDPAMMLYLDTQNSRKSKPNENFPREVMELFTLGEGNYTEKDISEAARAFTGYQINRFNGTVTHDRRQWDDSQKTVFGKTGRFNGKDVIELIFEKKEAARFLSEKIWKFFGNESPSASTLESLTNTFHQADFQIAPLLREIFLCREFYAETAIRSQIKSPIQYLVGILKQLEVTTPPIGFSITGQQQLGQILFMPPNVAGWDWGQAWINTNTLLSRYNLAGMLTKGSGNTPRAAERAPSEMNEMAAMAEMNEMAGIAQRSARGWQGPDYEKIAPRPLRDDPAELVDALIFRFFQSPVPEKARQSFIDYAIAKKGVIFTNKETAELCHLILSTPYYQLC
jgi:uncharacterized protein (DUF1800 family)